MNTLDSNHCNYHFTLTTSLHNIIHHISKSVITVFYYLTTKSRPLFPFFQFLLWNFCQFPGRKSFRTAGIFDYNFIFKALHFISLYYYDYTWSNSINQTDSRGHGPCRHSIHVHRKCCQTALWQCFFQHGLSTGVLVHGRLFRLPANTGLYDEQCSWVVKRHLCKEKERKGRVFM